MKTHRGSSIVELVISLLLLCGASLAGLRFNITQQQTTDEIVLRNKLNHYANQLRHMQQFCSGCNCPESILQAWQSFGRPLPSYRYVLQPRSKPTQCWLVQSATLHAQKTVLRSRLT